MSGDFRRFPELQMLVEGFAVQPGQNAAYAPARLPSPEATPTPWVCCDKNKIRPGSEL